jgi:CO/xanthine dehydrogenase Mo-binding subunit
MELSKLRVTPSEIGGGFGGKTVVYLEPLALALSRNAREARKVLLARLPTLEHAKLGGHTGGNLLLSMMQRYSGDFLDAVDGLRATIAIKLASRKRGSSSSPRD